MSHKQGKRFLDNSDLKLSRKKKNKKLGKHDIGYVQEPTQYNPNTNTESYNANTEAKSYNANLENYNDNTVKRSKNYIDNNSSWPISAEDNSNANTINPTSKTIPENQTISSIRFIAEGSQKYSNANTINPINETTQGDSNNDAINYKNEDTPEISNEDISKNPNENTQKNTNKKHEKNNKKRKSSRKKNDAKINSKNNPKKKKNNFLSNLIIFICILAILFSSYNIVLWFIDNNKNKQILSDVQSNISVKDEPTTIDDKTINKKIYDLTALMSQNSDTVGWINVPNTNIDYPVVQTTDNDYYLTHSFDKSENSAGWIFLDYRNNLKTSNYNTVIYGHNRKDQSMFGSLKTTLNEEWYSNENNLYITFAQNNETHIYKVFSTFICNADNVADYTQTNFASNNEFFEYEQMLKNSSSHDFSTEIESGDEILTLYTCYGLNNQRLLLCAKLVE